MRKRSCPAVSQICIVIFWLLITSSLHRKDAPIVDEDAEPRKDHRVGKPQPRRERFRRPDDEEERGDDGGDDDDVHERVAA